MQAGSELCTAAEQGASSWAPRVYRSFGSLPVPGPWITNVVELEVTPDGKLQAGAEPAGHLSRSVANARQDGVLVVELSPQIPPAAPILPRATASQFWLAASVACGALCALLAQHVLAPTSQPLKGSADETSTSPECKGRRPARSRSQHRAAQRGVPRGPDGPSPRGLPTADELQPKQVPRQACQGVQLEYPCSEPPVVTPVPTGVVPILASGAAGPVHRCTLSSSSKRSANKAGLRLKGPPGGGVRRRRQCVQGTLIFGSIDVQLEPVEVLYGSRRATVLEAGWLAAPPPVPTRKGGLRRLL